MTVSGLSMISMTTLYFTAKCIAPSGVSSTKCLNRRSLTFVSTLKPRRAADCPLGRRPSLTMKVTLSMSTTASAKHAAAPQRPQDPVCPNCNEKVVGHPSNGCVLGALIQCVRDRKTTDTALLEELHAKVDLDKLWQDVGPVISRLESGHYSSES